MIPYDPDAWVTFAEHHACSFHRENPNGHWAGCTCGGAIGQRPATPEERAENRRRRLETEREQLVKRLAALDRPAGCGEGAAMTDRISGEDGGEAGTAGHTPGPWAWRYEDESMQWLHGPGEAADHVLSVTPCKSCRKTTLTTGKFARCLGPTDADARLIAAAPELLAALQRLLSPDCPCVRCDIIRAAIAKATAAPPRKASVESGGGASVPPLDMKEG